MDRALWQIAGHHKPVDAMCWPWSPHYTQGDPQHDDDPDSFYQKIWGSHMHHGFWETRREMSEQATHQPVDFVA